MSISKGKKWWHSYRQQYAALLIFLVLKIKSMWIIQCSRKPAAGSNQAEEFLIVSKSDQWQSWEGTWISILICLVGFGLILKIHITSSWELFVSRCCNLKRYLIYFSEDNFALHLLQCVLNRAFVVTAQLQLLYSIFLLRNICPL